MVEDQRAVLQAFGVLLAIALVMGLALMAAEREADTCKPQLERILK